MRCLALPLLLGLALRARPALAEGPALLPEASLSLKAARYAPAETDLHWNGWIGAGLGLVRYQRATAYFKADVETILGNTRRAFEANQANYHLELGVHRRVGEAKLTVFFHHVSRHLVDRPKVRAIDWNILGGRASGRLPKEFFVPTRITLGVGHTTQASEVGYRWEMTLRADANLLTGRWGQAYLVSDARLITAERSLEFPRNGFIDLTLEGGMRFRRGSRLIETFVAFEHRNDVFVESPGSRDRALVGFRLGFAAPEEPPPPPGLAGPSGAPSP